MLRENVRFDRVGRYEGGSWPDAADLGAQAEGTGNVALVIGGQSRRLTSIQG